MRRTSQNYKIANFYVRKARIIIVVVLCVRGMRNYRALSFLWYLCLSVSRSTRSRDDSCKIFGRVVFCVHLSHSLVISWNLVACRVALIISELYIVISVHSLFPTFCKVVRDPADKHEVTPCLWRYHNRLLSRLSEHRTNARAKSILT